MTIKVLLADDQALLRSAFRVLVDSEPDMRVVGEASDGAQAYELTRAQRPDVVLMDIRMPGVDGLAATRMISEDPELTDVRVVILTTFEVDDYVVQSLRAGASGFLGKGAEPDEMLGAIRIAAAGEALLSPVATKGLIAKFLAQGGSSGDGGPGGRGAERLATLTGREREVLTLVGLRAVQRRDRRAARGQPAHGQDACQPRDGQAGRPGPLPAGGHRLRVGTRTPTGAVRVEPPVLPTRYGHRPETDLRARKSGQGMAEGVCGPVKGPAVRFRTEERPHPCPGCPDSASYNGA